jgi:XTP/dITP diphosphohydrolase
MKLLFATHNAHKLVEARNIVGKVYPIQGLDDIKFTDPIPEDGLTLEDNATFKARFVHERTGLDCFADDSGLEVEALNGAPGVKSARFAGDEADSERNIDLLLRMLEGEKNRRARFRTVIALLLENELRIFQGTIDGTIITERRGTNGFGYDAVFIPDHKNKTFAEMNAEEKNAISHRQKALHMMLSSVIGKETWMSDDV